MPDIRILYNHTDMGDPKTIKEFRLITGIARNYAGTPTFDYDIDGQTGTVSARTLGIPRDLETFYAFDLPSVRGLRIRGEFIFPDAIASRVEWQVMDVRFERVRRLDR
jgi:hypothetical protein